MYTEIAALRAQAALIRSHVSPLGFYVTVEDVPEGTLIVPTTENQKLLYCQQAALLKRGSSLVNDPYRCPPLGDPTIFYPWLGDMTHTVGSVIVSGHAAFRFMGDRQISVQFQETLEGEYGAWVYGGGKPVVLHEREVTYTATVVAGEIRETRMTPKRELITTFEIPRKLAMVASERLKQAFPALLIYSLGFVLSEDGWGLAAIRSPLVARITDVLTHGLARDVKDQVPWVANFSHLSV